MLREGDESSVLLEMPASTTSQGILARMGVGEEVSLKILCSEEYLVEDWPLLDYHTLRNPWHKCHYKNEQSENDSLDFQYENDLSENDLLDCWYENGQSENDCQGCGHEKDQSENDILG